MLRRLKKHFGRKLSLQTSPGRPSENTEPESEHSATTPEHSEAKPEHSAANPEHSEAKPEHSASNSEHSEANFESSEDDSERYENSSECSKIASDRFTDTLQKVRREDAEDAPPTIQAEAADNSIPTDIASQPNSAASEILLTPAENCIYEPSKRPALSKLPSVRITERCRLEPHTDNAVSAEVDRRLPEGKTYLTLGAKSFRLVAIGRVIVTPGSSQQTAVRLLNPSNRPVNVHARTVVAVLVPAQRAIRPTEYVQNQPDEGLLPKVNLAAISDDSARGILAFHLSQYRHLFARDTCRIPPDDRKLPNMERKGTPLVEYDTMNELPTYFAECRLARSTFPFPTETCAIRYGNDASWQLAMSYADRYIPRRFHATLQLPTESHLPSSAPKARYITTLTPLNNAPNAVPAQMLHRLVALCTTDFEQLTLPPGYEQSVADLQTHISSVAEAYAPVILFATQDATDPGIKYLKLVRHAGLHLSADRSFVAAIDTLVCH